MLYILHGGTPSPCLQSWSARTNAKLVPFSAERPDLRSALADVPDEAHGHPVVIVLKYPAEEEADVEAVAVFCDWVTDNPGRWFYAPRPNPYLSVEHSALVGVQKWDKRTVRHTLKERMLAAYGRMPGWARPLLRRFGRPLAAGLLKSAKTAESNASRGAATQISVGAAGPEIQVPQDLQMVGAEWREWTAPDAVLSRDLLDRPALFFPHPRGIHVIVLNKCNLKCVMCPYHSPTYKPAHKSDYFEAYRPMVPEVFSKIADYAGKHNIALQFGQIEEPLMHKGVIDFLQEARDKGVQHIHMTTNGTLLTRDKADALVESGLTSLMVSIDAANPDTYKEIRGGDLEVVESNLRYFISKAKPKGIKVWVSFILQPQATAEREAFLAKWRSLGVDYITFYGLSDHDLETGELVDFKHMYDRDEERYPCASPWMQSVVFPDGEVSLCCRTMGMLGWTGVIDVGTLAIAPDFESVWSGPKYRTVRKELLDNTYEHYTICQDCSIWSASTALTEEGNGYKRTYNETMETFEFR